MKKISIGYILYGSIDVDVSDTFETNDSNVEDLLRSQSDKDLIAGIEGYGAEIDGDAIELKEYNELIPGEDYDM